MNSEKLQAVPLCTHTLVTSEAARYLDISLGHLYNLLSAGRGPRHVKYGGQLRFRPADLDHWIAERCVLVPSRP